MNKFSSKSVEVLNYYVYSLEDPRSNETFYIGKGTGNRVFSHKSYNEEWAKEVRKIQRINEIENAGFTVIRKIIIFGLNEEEAFAAESALINFIGLDILTNIVSGHHSYDVYTVEQFESIYAAEKVEIEDSVILIRVNNFWHKDITKERLYAITRGIWKINEHRANNYNYVFSVYNGLVKGIYEVDTWHRVKVGDLDPAANKVITENDEWAFKRSYFTGREAPKHILDKYLNKDISDYLTKGAQNPIQYIDISES